MDHEVSDREFRLALEIVNRCISQRHKSHQPVSVLHRIIYDTLGLSNYARLIQLFDPYWTDNNLSIVIWEK